MTVERSVQTKTASDRAHQDTVKDLKGVIPKPYWLVVSTPLKNISQLGWLFPIYGEKNVPNHQPAWKFKGFMSQVSRDGIRHGNLRKSWKSSVWICSEHSQWSWAILDVKIWIPWRSWRLAKFLEGKPRGFWSFVDSIHLNSQLAGQRNWNLFRGWSLS